MFLFICLFVQTLTNAFMGYTNAALMRFATIPKIHTIAYAIMDSREMDGNVKVGVGSLNNYAIIVGGDYAGRDIYGRDHIEK